VWAFTLKVSHAPILVECLFSMTLLPGASVEPLSPQPLASTNRTVSKENLSPRASMKQLSAGRASPLSPQNSKRLLAERYSSEAGVGRMTRVGGSEEVGGAQAAAQMAATEAGAEAEADAESTAAMAAAAEEEAAAEAEAWEGSAPRAVSEGYDPPKEEENAYRYTMCRQSGGAGIQNEAEEEEEEEEEEENVHRCTTSKQPGPQEEQGAWQAGAGFAPRLSTPRGGSDAMRRSWGTKHRGAGVPADGDTLP
jgi:hypothetical protein